MTLVLEPPMFVSATNSPAARQLQERMAAVRLSFTWFGVRKTLTSAQRAQAAEPFGALDSYLSAGKKLLDTGHHAFRGVTTTRGLIQAYFRSVSLPYPEAGIRLVRQDQLTEFDQQLIQLRVHLGRAVTELEQHYDELRSLARQRLGTLYSDGDYPPTLTGLFSVDWDYPSVEPPEYLRQVNPELYAQEQARIVARFEEAVTLAEDAFAAEFSKLVSHLTDRISGARDGKPKIFRDTAITHLHEFFERFRSLSVRSNTDLDELINRSQQLLRGVQPQTLRDNGVSRKQLATQLASVQSALDGMLMDRPRRNLIRPPQESGSVA